MRRLGLLAAVAATLVALLAAAAGPAAAYETPHPPLRDGDYLRFADRVTAELESSWSDRDGMYRSGARSIDTIMNAAMLTVHATSAAHGHDGASRNDARARTLVDRLTAAPHPFYTGPEPAVYDKMFHAPGWTSNMDGAYVDMDKSIDPKVAEGLQIAHRARDVLGLDAAQVQRIEDQVRAVSHVGFFRYPLVRLNQINWPAELYGYDMLVNGDPGLLRTDYRKQVMRFVRGMRKPWTKEGATNTGPTYRFIYQNNYPESHSRNLDSAEYAGMTLHFLYWYGLARSVGMAPLPADDVRLLRGWAQRNLYGYWTHSGFMNWDTGWSYDRWMKGKTWAYAQQGLLALATRPEFNLRRDETLWAKYLFDRGLKLYEHLSHQPGAQPWRADAEMYGIGEQGLPTQRMYWARMAANAARAVSAGLGRLDAAPPPPMYAFDADIGRLAVSTPRYHTAITAVSRSKLPYGGLDLARLYDGDGDPIGGTGGKPPGSFGVTLHRMDGRRTLATQRGLRSDPARPPVKLTNSPRGPVRRVRRLPTRPDAGPFDDDLAARSVRRGDGARIVTEHAFRRNAISARYTITRSSGPGRRQARVLFPTTGRKRVAVIAVLRSGDEVLLDGASTLDLAGVREFRLHSRFGSYRVVPLAPLRGRARLIARRWRKANPTAGPTLALDLPVLRRGTRRVAVDLFPSTHGGMLGSGQVGEAAATGAGSSPGPAG